ncbi:hypothetical protein B0H13DRAFT_1865832 [Mycena leptocephala]|nr:hypothetical protein B0H13DRAFT_1865832 [Mycena leptocephala]
MAVGRELVKESRRAGDEGMMVLPGGVKLQTLHFARGDAPQLISGLRSYIATWEREDSKDATGEERTHAFDAESRHTPRAHARTVAPPRAESSRAKKNVWCTGKDGPRAGEIDKGMDANVEQATVE